MVEENKTGEVAAGQTGDVAVAEQQQAGVKESEAAVQKTEAEKGQLAALEAERKKRQDAEQKTANLEQQFLILQASQMRQQAVQQPAQQQDFFGQQGLTDEEFINVKQLRQYAGSIMQQNQLTQQQQAIANFIGKHPDYGILVGTAAINPVTQQPVFVPSAILNQIVAENPELANLSDPIAAYFVAKRHQENIELKKQQDAIKEKEINQQVDLKTSPLPASAAGGAGKVDLTASIAALDMRNPADREKLRQLEAQAMAG